MSVHAQLLGNLNGVTISTSPQYPRPHQESVATVRSGNVDVSAATIVWLVNDEIQQQGEGNTSFVFTTGELGATQHITALVRTVEGQVLSDSLSIQPAQVALLWEGDTYTPPFYKGRALYTPESRIRVEARAEIKDDTGRRYTDDELIYTWRRNDSALNDASGLGRSVLITNGPKFFGDDIISVEVTTKDKSIIATSAALVPTREPLVLLYKNDPLIGTMYHRSIETEHVFRQATQIGLQAHPLYMDTQNINSSSLNYVWKIDGKTITADEEKPSYMTLSFNNNEDFSTRASVSVEHLTHLLQTATNNWLLHFEGSARATPFGR